MYLEFFEADEDGNAVVVEKDGHPLHLLTEARRHLRHLGDGVIHHIHLCMCDCEASDG